MLYVRFAFSLRNVGELLHECGEAFLPKDLAVSSSLFPFGYSENAAWLPLRHVNAKCIIAALALLRCSIILIDMHPSSRCML